MTLENLLNNLRMYDEKEIEQIKKAYYYADYLHNGQFRQSGEKYITHPLNVAYILSELNADSNTICAGLLHDTIEDTKITKDDIANIFNDDIAKLVDGVTKLAKMNFSSKEDLNNANTRKIITSITTDVRIIIIKLADRLHNMRTLSFKSRFKQKENAIETMEIFVPLSYCIGAYRIKSELEDLSFRYLKPDIYKKTMEEKRKIEYLSRSCLDEMYEKITCLLNTKNITNKIKVRTKNIYGIYKRLNEGKRLSDIHDLLALKVIVDEIDNCYMTLGLIHSLYHPINDRFKDYICNPKTNMYRSLHTTVFGVDEKLVQAQIRTFDMDKIASLGLTAYWTMQKNARYIMQKDLHEKFQFFKSLTEINSMFLNNQDFVHQVKKELFSDKVYVYTPKGDTIELPKGSTIIDFAYKIHTEIANHMIGVLVNDKNVEFNYVLQNKDRVRIITDSKFLGPDLNWFSIAHTSLAKKKIKEFKK